MLTALARFPEWLAAAAEQRAPQLLANGLRELATTFHSFYTSQPILSSPAPLRDARLALAAAVRQVLAVRNDAPPLALKIVELGMTGAGGFTPGMQLNLLFPLEHLVVL